MNRKIIIALAVLVVIAATLSANGSQDVSDTYGRGNGQGSGLRDGSGNGQGNGTGQGRNSSGNSYRENFIEELSTVYGIEPGSGVLNTEENNGLLLMVEEEKLAHDVYSRLYELWNIPIFNNIAESEQQHMDAVKLILDAYNVETPEEIHTAGTFKNTEIQNYYDSLVAQGAASVEEALKVGATIEDLDIADLQKLLENTENDEVKILYQNLMKGSRNHMRSFTAQLDRYGIGYEPAFITNEYYEKILKYNRESTPISDPDYSI